MAEAAPELVAMEGVGTDTAASLLIAAGDNPERLKSEAAFARRTSVRHRSAWVGAATALAACSSREAGR